jgi:hypothetical protein
MKSIVQDSSGPPASVLKLQDVAKSGVSNGEVLHARRGVVPAPA